MTDKPKEDISDLIGRIEPPVKLFGVIAADGEFYSPDEVNIPKLPAPHPQ